MVENFSQVKVTNPSLYMLFLFVMTFGGCASEPSHEAPLIFDSQGVQDTLLPPGEWVGLGLDEGPYARLRSDLEKQNQLEIASPLKHRGEAHLTLLTPPEFKSLRSTLGEKRLHEILAQIPWTNATWSPVCIGRGEVSTKDTSLQTFYVVIDSPDLIRLRQKLWILAGKPASFQAEDYAPHITLGFTHRDLHREEGVRKDRSSCWRSLKLAPRRKE